MTSDEFAEIVGGAATDALQQFGIVTRGFVGVQALACGWFTFTLAVLRRSGPAGARTPTVKSLRRPLARVDEGRVGNLIRAPPEIADLLTLFMGQDGRNFAVNVHPFNRQIGLHGGDLG